MTAEMILWLWWTLTVLCSIAMVVVGVCSCLILFVFFGGLSSRVSQWSNRIRKEEKE